ncbi:RNA polymerase subunit sigma-54 [Asticcacaulis sp. AC460]|uniref:response regulator transcription factor n=1 Tax=Asticcacaulis sp. AC460 TaxID=1282360 RepID=UPI0003C3E970|nr:response regulator [Asticcacaulis sp. AC460]ESQ87734.1 RNA polymerase subunit sigma-54 [Asticcacaulis sp. AC460]
MLQNANTDKRKILVVDDDENVRLLVKVLLSRRGYEVETAPGGMAGLAALSLSTPDLVLLDISMPDMDGLSFLEKRAQAGHERDIPVIVLSARNSEADIDAAMTLGASNYVAKPFHQDQLLGHIARFLPQPPVNPMPSHAVH